MLRRVSGVNCDPFFNNQWDNGMIGNGENKNEVVNQ